MPDIASLTVEKHKRIIIGKQNGEGEERVKKKMPIVVLNITDSH
jgi:hypothetical protein